MLKPHSRSDQLSHGLAPTGYARGRRGDTVSEFLLLLSSLGLSADALLRHFPEDKTDAVLDSLGRLARLMRRRPVLAERLAFYVDQIRRAIPSERRARLDALTDLRLHLSPSKKTLSFVAERDITAQLEQQLFALVGLEPPEMRDEDRNQVAYARGLVTFLEMAQTLLAGDANVGLLLRVLSQHPHLQAYYADHPTTQHVVLKMAEAGFNIDHLVFGRSQIGTAGASAERPESWSEHLIDLLRQILGTREDDPEVSIWPRPGKVFHQFRDDIKRIKEEDEEAALHVIDEVLPELELRYEQLRLSGQLRKASHVEEVVQDMRYLQSILSGDLERVTEPTRLRARRSYQQVPEILFDNTRFSCCLFKPSGLFHWEISRLLLDPATPMLEYWLDPYPEILGLATLYAGIDAQRRPTLLVDTVDYDDRLLGLRGNNGTLRFMLNTMVLDAKLSGAKRLAIFAAPYGKPINFANFVKGQSDKSEAMTYHERYYFESVDPSDAALRVSQTGMHHYTVAFGYMRPLMGVIQYGYNLVQPGQVLPYPEGGEGVVEIDVDAFIEENDLSDKIPEPDPPVAEVADAVIWRRPSWHEEEVTYRIEQTDEKATADIAALDETLTLEVHAPPSADIVDVLLSIDEKAFDADLQYGADDLDVRLRCRDATVLLVRSEDGKAIAFALGYVSPALGPDAFYLDDLAVIPDAQGRGLGSALVDHLAHRAMQRGFLRLYALAQAGRKRELEAFYTQNSFQTIGAYGALGTLFIRSLHVASVTESERLSALLTDAEDRLSSVQNVSISLHTAADEELISVMRRLERVFPPHMRYTEAQFRQRMLYPDAYALVVSSDDVPVAFGISYDDPALPGHTIFLDTMSVRPSEQRKGIGKVLFRLMRQIPALSHYTQAVFYCQDTSASGLNLVEYYENLGARRIDTIDGKNRMQVDLRVNDLLSPSTSPTEPSSSEDE